MGPDACSASVRFHGDRGDAGQDGELAAPEGPSQLGDDLFAGVLARVFGEGDEYAVAGAEHDHGGWGVGVPGVHRRNAIRRLSWSPMLTAASRSALESTFWLDSGTRLTSGRRSSLRSASSTCSRGSVSASLARIRLRETQLPVSGAS